MNVESTKERMQFRYMPVSNWLQYSRSFALSTIRQLCRIAVSVSSTIVGGSSHRAETIAYAPQCFSGQPAAMELGIFLTIEVLMQLVCRSNDRFPSLLS